MNNQIFVKKLSMFFLSNNDPNEKWFNNALLLWLSLQANTNILLPSIYFPLGETDKDSTFFFFFFLKVGEGLSLNMRDKSP